MARHTDPSIKENLTEQCLDAFFQKGLQDFSLRNLAKAIGTSARMLVYHFGSAEGLLIAVIQHFSRKEKERFTVMMQEQDWEQSLGDFFYNYCHSSMRGDLKNAFILFIEIYARALRNPQGYTTFFKEVLHEWIGLIQQLLEQKFQVTSQESQEWATLVVGMARGLLLDWLASGDDERILKTVHQFKLLIDHKFVRL